MLGGAIVDRAGRVHPAPTLEGLGGTCGHGHLYVGGERALVAFAL